MIWIGTRLRKQSIFFGKRSNAMDIVYIGIVAILFVFSWFFMKLIERV